MTYGHCDVCRITKVEVHCFPRDIERARYWAKLLNWEEEFEKLARRKKHIRNIFLCQSHFSQSSYFADGPRMKLRKDACPVEVMPPPPRSPIGSQIGLKTESNINKFPMIPHRLPAEPKKIGEFFDATEQDGNAMLNITLENLRTLIKPMGCIKCNDQSGERSMKKEGKIAIVTMDCPKCGIIQWSSASSIKEEPM